MLSQVEMDLFLHSLTIAIAAIFCFAIIAILFALFSQYLPRSYTRSWKQSASESDTEKTPSPTRKAKTGLINKRELQKLTRFCEFSRRDMWENRADGVQLLFGFELRHGMLRESRMLNGARSDPPCSGVNDG